MKRAFFLLYYRDEERFANRSRLINSTSLLKVTLFFLLFILFCNGNLNAQLIGSPGSRQSAVERCSPASFWITYTFEIDGGTIPPGFYRLVFRLVDQEGTFVTSASYFKTTTRNEIAFPQSPDPPFNYIATKSHLFILPDSADCEFTAQMYFYWDPDGIGPQNWITVDITQIQKLSNWHTDDQGDGYIAIAPDTLEHCEGVPLANFRFQDASHFACTNPVTLSKPNSVERHVQFIYGTHPNAAQGIPNLYINNGTTNVYLTDATGAPVAFPTASGFYEGPIVSTGTDQQVGSQLAYPISFNGIGTAMDDYFEVTVRNWNYCNPWNGNLANPNSADAKTSSARIVIVDAPSPPTAPSRTVCFGADRTLTATSIPVGTFRWYSNAALTTEVGSGPTFETTLTAPNTYNFWLVDQDDAGLQCKSPATMVTLVINPLPGKPTLDHPNKNSLCYDGGISTYTITAKSTPPVPVTGYQWYKDGILLPGETNVSIVLSEPEHSGWYSVSTIGPAPTFCYSPQSDQWEVSVHTLSNLTNPVPTTVCEGQMATFSAWTTDEVHVWQWEKSTDGGLTYSTLSMGVPYQDFNEPTMYINPTPASFNGQLFRVEIKTPPGQGGCTFKSGSAMLTVNTLPTANAGAPLSRCTPTPTDPIYMTGAVAGGSFTAANWTGGEALGTWTQNINPALAYFAPSVSSGSFTATITVYGTAACGGVTATSTRVISWGQTPTAEAGANLSRCDANPFGGFIMTGAFAGGSYSGVAWTGGGGLGTWTQNPDPALAIFTPSTTSGSFTATLTVTGLNGCLGTNATDTKTITWGQTPVVNAGIDFSRCDVTPTAPISMAGAVATGTFSAATWSGGEAFGTWTQNINPALATYTPSVNAGLFTAILTLTGTGACAGFNPSDTRIIEWGYAATVNAGPDQSVCANATVPLAGVIGGGATSATWSGGTGTYSPDNTTLNAIYTPSLAERTAHTVTLILTTDDPVGACAWVSDNVTISIGTEPDAANLTGSGDGCYGVTSSLRTFITGGAPPYTLDITGHPGSPISGYVSGSDIDLGVLAVGTYDYILVKVTDGCGNELDLIEPYSIIISQVPDAASTVNNTPVICNDGTTGIVLHSDVPGTNYSWTVSTSPLVSWQSGKEPVPGNQVNGEGFTLAQNLAHNGTGPVTVTYTITPVGPTSCQGTPITRTVIVQPTVTVTATGMTTCSATPIIIDVNTISTGTYGVRYNWTVVAPAGVSGASNGPVGGVTFATNISQTLTNSTLNSQVVTYTITGYTLDSGGALSCPGTPLSIDVSVEPNVVVTASGATICSGSSTNIDVNTLYSSTNGIRYTWTAVPQAGVTGASNGNAGTQMTTNIVQTLTNSATSPRRVTYNITGYTLDAGGLLNCAGPTHSVDIWVEPAVVISATGGGVTFCNSGSTNIDVNTTYTGTNGVRYSWTVSAPAGVGGASDGPAGGTAFTNNIIQTLTNSTLTTQRVTYTITGYTLDAGGALSCPGTPASLDVWVEPTITVTATGARICNGTSANIDVNTDYSSNNGVKYYWAVSAPAGVSGASNGPVAGTDFSVNIIQTLTNTTLTSQRVTYTIRGYTLTAGGALYCPGLPQVVEIWVEPTVQVTATGGGVTLCNGQSTNIDVNTTFSATNGVRYNWTVNAPAGISGASDGPAGGAAFNTNISQSLTNSTLTTQLVTYTITGYTLDAGGGLSCSGPPITLNVWVEPNVLVSASGETICSGSSTNIDVSTLYTPANGVLYNWTVSAPAGINGATDGPAGGTAFSNNIVQTLNNTSLTSQLVTYTITGYTLTSGGALNCAGTPLTVNVWVEPVVDLTAPGTILCNGSATNIDVNTSHSATYGVLYTWTVSAPAGVSGALNGPAGGVDFNNNIVQPLTNSTLTSQRVTYTITGHTLTSGGNLNCPGTTINTDIWVEPTVLITSTGGGVTLCSGSSTSIDINTIYSATNGVKYNWTVNAPAGITGASDGPAGGTAFSDNIAQALTNTTFATQMVTYTITGYTLDAGGALSCPGTPVSVNIFVDPAVEVTATGTTLCNGASTNIDVSTSHSATYGIRYNWIVSAPAGVSGALNGPAGGVSFATNIVQTLNNTTLTNQTVTYTITGYTLTDGGALNCAGPSRSIDVIVRPDIIITPGQNPTVCSSTSLNYRILMDNFINPGDNVLFTWSAPSLNPADPDFTGGTDRLSGSSANITDLFINTTGSDGTATYTVTPHKDGCDGPPIQVIVTISSEPVIDPGLNRTICSSTPTGLMLTVASGSIPATSYNVLDVTRETGLLADAGNAPYPRYGVPDTYVSTDRFINETGVNKTVTYRAQPVFGPGCYGSYVDIIVTVRPQPVITPAQAKTVCSGVSIDKEILLLQANTPAGTLFNWPMPTLSDASGQGTAGVDVPSDPAGTIHIDDRIDNFTGFPITAIYQVTPVSADGCSGNTVPVTITVNPEPLIKTISGRDMICVNEVNLVYQVTPSPGSTFHWTVDPDIGTKTFDFNTSTILINSATIPGSGDITVYETNLYGCNGDTTTFPVEVFAKALPENLSGPAAVCAYSTRAYSVTSRVGSVYSWTIPGGASIIGDPSAASVSVLFGNVGGNISVRETTAAGCVTDHTPLTVIVRPLPTAILNGGGTICEGGSASLFVDFTGTAPYTLTYAIDGVSQAPVGTSADPYTLTATQSGLYTILSVSDATTCSNIGFGSALISYYPKPTGIISGGATICGGESTTLTMSFTGTPPYTFTYSDGPNSYTVPNYLNAVYTVAVTPPVTRTYTLVSLIDGHSCSGALSGSAIVMVNIPPVLVFTPTNLTCNGDNTGEIDLSITGNDPFGIVWTGPGGFTSNSEDLNGLAAGTYNVTVNDTRGCTSTGSVTLTQPGPLNATLTSTNIFCFGSPEGTITISAPSGGSGSFEYSIDGGLTWELSGSFTGLNPDTYDVRIHDAVNPICERILNAALILTGPDVLDATVTSLNIDCYDADNGSIVISNPSGGFGSYEYSINGGISWESDGNYINLPPGFYDVRIHDASNKTCEITLNGSLELTEPDQLAASFNSTNITCFNANDGTITISGPTGGSGSYRYSINGGATWQDNGNFTNLIPDSYDVTIGDAINTNCYIVLNTGLILAEPSEITATINGTDVTCFGAADGIITVENVLGGSGSYQFTNDGGLNWQPSNSFTGLIAGNYDVRISDVSNPACVAIINNAFTISQPDVLNATVTPSMITCNGADDGIITITNPSGGYGTYEYSIDGGATWFGSGLFTGLTPGPYDVRIKDGFYPLCEIILNGSLQITEPDPLSATLTYTDVTCNGADNGTITISSPSGGYGTFDYTIDGATWLPSGEFMNLAPGSYNVQIRDRAYPLCISTLNSDLQITEPDLLSGIVTYTNVTCNGAHDGTITISSPGGGYGTYQYSIDGGGSWHDTEVFTGLIPGSYNVRIRDAAHLTCFEVLNPALLITQPNTLSATVTSTHVTCAGVNDGTITVSSPSGGYGTYDYSIDGGLNWQDHGDFTGLEPGPYEVKIRDAANQSCVIILDNLGITEPGALSANLTKNDITCFGSNDGKITISLPSGGSGTYNFSIDGGLSWQLSGAYTGLPQGIYDVRLQDRAHPGCFIILDNDLVIIEPDILSATVTSTDVTCNGANDGIITISGATGGYGSYQYSINGGANWFSSGSFSFLPPSTYNLVIRDVSNPACRITLNGALIIGQPDALAATVTKTDVTCFAAGDGTITITAPTGGSGNFEYSNNGGASWQSSETFTDLGPGYYNVQMRDADHIYCVKVLNNSLHLTQPSQVNAVVTATMITCNGEDNGIISLTSPTGGYGSYQYSIDGGGHWFDSGEFIDLPPGVYNVQIRDAVYQSCVNTLNSALTITEPFALNATVTYTNISCNGANDGAINISYASGGYGTYEYNVTGTWQTTGYFTGLAPSTYVVQIRDRAHPDCIIVLDPGLVLTEPDQLSATVSSTDVECFGANNGRITITNPLGGYGTYAYSVNGGSGWQSSGIFNNLPPGDYDVRIRDAAHPLCFAVLTPVTITEPDVLTADVSGTDITCYGASDGTITISNPLGGYGTYQYTIDGGFSWHDSGQFTDLAAGLYNVQIRDAAHPGCVVILNGLLMISEPSMLSAIVTKTNVTCFGAGNGTIIITGASGGYGAHEYSIDNGFSWQTSGIYSGLVSGTYNVRIRDELYKTCEIVLNPGIVITEPAVLNATVSSVMVTCSGANDGRISVTSPTGGSGFYLYSITGGASWQGSGTFNNISPATYDIRIRDAASPACTMTLGLVTITQPDVLSATVTGTDVTCFGGNDGSITISSPAGGYGHYEFSINGGVSWQVSGFFQGLPVGQYNILMRDEDHQNCMVILDSSFPVDQPDFLSATVSKTDITCNGANDGSVTISSPAGGYGTYEYSVDGGTTWDGTGIFTGLNPGPYNVQIQDAAHPGCRAILNPNLVIIEPLAITMTSTGNIILNCNGDSYGSGSFYAAGGVMPYTFNVISNTAGAVIPAQGFNSQAFNSAGAGSITVSVTDSRGCSDQATITVTEPEILTPGAIEDHQVLCSGQNPAPLTETAAASGGPGAYVYRWQYALDVAGPFIDIDGATDYQYTPPANATATLFYRRMVASGLCPPVYSNIVEVKVNPLPFAILYGGETICPGASSILKATITNGTGPYELDIENHGIVTDYDSGDNIPVTPGSTTTYRLLRVTDSNGCEVISPSAGLMGTPTVTVRTLPSITVHPQNRIVCELTMVSFTVTATGSNLTYQWYVDDGFGFDLITDGGIYYGATGTTLSIFGPTRLMNDYAYHVVVSGCGTSVTSSDAYLTVNTAPEIITQPADSTICMNAGATFEVEAEGDGLSYKWQVNTGSGFGDITDNSNFTGSDMNVLTISNATSDFNNYTFRVRVDGTCGAVIYSDFASLRVISPPSVVLHPISIPVCENAGPIIFSSSGTGMIDSLRWEVYSGGTWSEVFDNTIYTGATSQQLRLTNVPIIYNGNQYRLGFKTNCGTEYSNPAVLTVHSNPVVDFSAIDPIDACGGEPIVIDGNPSGGTGIYNQHTWTGDIGPLNSYNIQTPVFNTVITGTYVMNYRVRDTNGCYANDNITVVVDKPDASFESEIEYGCTPVNAVFTKEMTGITKFWWDFGDGSPVDSINANPEHEFINPNPTAIGYYHVTLTVQAATGCEDSFTMTITVYPQIDATFTANKILVCSGELITFTTVTPGASKYSWDYGDGNSQTTASEFTTHIYTNFTEDPVIHTVELVTTSFYNCTDTSTVEITVMPVPIPDFKAAPVTQIFNPAGSPVTFTDQTNDGTWVYNWKFGDGGTSALQNPTHTYNAVGDYIVTLIVGNASCSDSTKQTIRITPIPPVADFDSIPSGCAPLTITLNNTSLYAEPPAATYLWDFGDGYYSTARNPSHTYSESGIYRIELKVTGPGGTSVRSRIVEAYVVPEAELRVAPTLALVDESVRFFNLSRNGDTFIWEFGDGDTSQMKEPTHKYVNEGVYDVTLWAYTINGCSDVYILSPAVTVERSGDIIFPTVFRPNPNGPIDMDHLPTGGDEVDQFFYPPIREPVSVYKLQIFNRWGTLIFESLDINRPWNGYYKNKICPQGVYVWLVEGKYVNGRPFRKAGDVTLLH